MLRVWVSKKSFFNPGVSIALFRLAGHNNKNGAGIKPCAVFAKKERLSNSDARTIEEGHGHRKVLTILQFLLFQNTQRNLLTEPQRLGLIGPIVNPGPIAPEGNVGR